MMCILKNMQQNKRLSAICKRKRKDVAQGPIDALPSEALVKLFQGSEGKRSSIVSTC